MRYTTRIIVPPKVLRSGQPGGKEARYAPQVVGIKKSFGFGDRLGLAAPGHLRAAAAYRDWTPFFAQQSAEELAETGRTTLEVMRAAYRTVEEHGYKQPWGADANRLKTPGDVEAAAEAKYTYFTIDPSVSIDDGADGMSTGELESRIESMILDSSLPENWSEPYLGRSIDLPGDWKLDLTLEPLQRAAVKFGRAIQHCVRMYEAIARNNRGRPFEIEVCLDGTALPATPLEHVFVGLELEARGVRVSSLALRLAGDFEAGMDYAGDLEAFEERLKGHAVIAQFCGPYKLSLHGGSDKFSVYPILGRVCGEQLHIKTSGTSYLEGLRAVARADAVLFLEIARFGQERCSAAKGTVGNVSPNEAENHFLDEKAGRQMLLATYGPVLTTGRGEDGQLFKEAIVETLNLHADLHHEIIAAHFEKHLRMLGAG